MATASSSPVAPGEAARLRPEPPIWSPVAAPAGGAFCHAPACWALDVSAARPVIASIVAGSDPPNWVAALLAGVRIADADERAVHLVGQYRGRESMIGRPVTEFWPPESRPMLADLILAAAADYPADAPRAREVTSIAFANALLRAWTGDGGGDGDIVFLSIEGTIVDDRSLWAVRASEERYRNLLHHLPIALLQVDARAIGAVYDGLRRSGVRDLMAYMEEHPELIDTANALVQVTEVNARAADLFGASDDVSLIGPVGYLFAVAPEAAKRVMAARFEGRRSHAETMQLRTFDGRLRDVAITVAYPKPPERLDVTLISIEDVTDRLRTEAQLRQLQADHSRAARISMLGELATSIAHEVNQPLSAIVTNAETSLRWLKRPDPNLSKVGQLTARIAESARHASGIVQRIRGMAGPRAPECIPLDLNEIVEETLLFVRGEIDSRAIDLSVELAGGLPQVLGDRVQLQQVMVNLILNAVQALAGAGLAQGQIAVRTELAAKGWVAFAIRDAGPGIAADNLDRIFESFFTTKADGIGIGLAICQSIIIAHGGTIAASNHPDGGALFRVLLPPVDSDLQPTA